MKAHFEPYLYLAGLTHKSALIAWGGFYFRVARTSAGWRLIDDSDLDHVHPPRSSSIGSRSFPYGHAHVEVGDESGKVVATGETRTANHVWVTGLEPDTEYRYRVIVNGREWAGGPRRDWAIGSTPAEQGLVESGRGYDNRFRTHPRPDMDAALAFAAIGDFGTGVRRPSSEGRRQREVAAALEEAVEREGLRLLLTTGDNIYAGRTLLGIPVGATGDEDDDWFFTFYQPYRYIMFGERFFRHVNHAPFLQAAFPPPGGKNLPRWRIPFSHHPPYSAGPQWGNSRSSIEHLVPLYRRSGVRMVLSGHEHNFQHSRVDGIDYFVTGGGGKVRTGRPGGFTSAGTLAWAPSAHFLLVRLAGTRGDVTAVGEDGRPLTAVDPSGQAVAAHTAIEL